MVVSSSSDDDGPVAPPSLRVRTPPPAALARAEMHEMPWMRETMMATPDSVWATSATTTHVAPEATARVAAGVPKTIVTPPMEAARVTTAVPETTRVVLVAAVETPSEFGYWTDWF